MRSPPRHPPDSGRRPARPALLVLCAVALLVGCGRRDAASRQGQRSPRLVVPEASGGGDQGLGDFPAAVARPLESSPKIALDSREKLLFVTDVNLNLERTDEQVLVTKDPSEPQARIRVSVVEYDAVLQAYRRSWEDETSATDERYVAVSTQDVVGDHSLEIICQGSTGGNRLTMDIYRKSMTAGTKLSYSVIFSAVSPGDIDIQEEPRSQAYLAGDADGKPFAIVVTEPDPESPDSPDIVKVTYQWSTRDRRYVEAGRARIRGEMVEREQLQALFSADSPEQYLTFLDGSWLRGAQDGQADAPTVGELIRFSPKDRTLQIYSAENRVQEEYTWDKDKVDAYYRNVTIRNARNSILPDITKDVRVNVVSLQEVQVTVESTIDRTDYWKATYRRVSDDVLARELAAPRRPDAVLQPAGLYQSEAGDQLIFQAPRFTWVAKDQAVSGGFYLYRLDRLVLGLLVQKGYGERPEERAYIVEQTNRVEADRVVRTLTLQPSELTVYGARPLSEELLVFTQAQTQGTQSEGHP